MKADRRTLEQIFETTIRLVAPLFQRSYVWEQERNWEPLWDTIREVADANLAGEKPRPSFLGAIVVGQLLGGRLGDVNHREIIDGQQRLTTLQILFAVLRDISGQAGFEKLQRAFSKFTHNDAPLCDDPDVVFKVWPTNADQDHFRRAMQAGSKEKLHDAYGVGLSSSGLSHPIPSAYVYFNETVSEWLGDQGQPEYEERLKALYATLRQDIVVVAIDLEERDDPQITFETLNALGTPLLPSDLVKNYLFHQAEKEGLDKQSLYDAYWKPFERNDCKGRRKIVARGGAKA